MSRIGIVGDVTATAGTTFPYTLNGAPVADSGTWQPGPITYSSYAEFEVGGGPVIWKATCTFTLAGGKLGNSAATASETVTLEADPHPMQAQANSVLVDGDTATNLASGNKLVVAASSTLATTT